MLTAKKQKKVYRQLNEQHQMLNILYTDKVYEYFVLFCADMLFDKIGEIFKFYAVFNYHRGIGLGQEIVAVILVIQMIKYGRRIK